MNQTLPEDIRMLLMDVDGVLTDGSLFFSAEGEVLKRFHVRDGLGIRMLQKAGIETGVITGRSSSAVAARCKDLDIPHVHMAVKDKAALVKQMSAKTGIPAKQMAFIGDDLVDISIMKTVGVGVAVADAHPLVRQAAHVILLTPGGQGAVRELAEAILKAAGKWEAILTEFGAKAP